MKKGFIVALLLNLVILTVYFQKDIVNFILDKTNKKEQVLNVTNIVYNEYKSNFNYLYINELEKNTPKSIEELKKYYYSILNSGMSEVSFYCEEDYPNCIKDIASISNDSNLLSTLNNYVHPYNSFKYISTNIYDNKVTIKITHNYDKRMIYDINNKVNQIISKYITPNMNDKEKIRVIHDYIINTTKYDKNKSENSHLAYGALLEGLAICSGYTDAMSIFLYKLNIPNYKISDMDEEHIWNLVKLDDKWYHLDLTWDDPINDLTDVLSHKYFLITTDELNRNDQKHIFNEQIYLEL